MEIKDRTEKGKEWSSGLSTRSSFRAFRSTRWGTNVLVLFESSTAGFASKPVEGSKQETQPSPSAGLKHPERQIPVIKSFCCHQSICLFHLAHRLISRKPKKRRTNSFTSKPIAARRISLSFLCFFRFAATPSKWIYSFGTATRKKKGSTLDANVEPEPVAPCQEDGILPR